MTPAGEAVQSKDGRTADVPGCQRAHRLRSSCHRRQGRRVCRARCGESRSRGDVSSSCRPNSTQPRFPPQPGNLQGVRRFAPRHRILLRQEPSVGGLAPRQRNSSSGLCYQRLVVVAGESRHSLHGLGAAYFEEFGWYRIDPRGNKPGVRAKIIPPVERLAFPIVAPGERNLPEIWPEPLAIVVRALTENGTFDQVFRNLPDIDLLGSARRCSIIVAVFCDGRDMPTLPLPPCVIQLTPPGRGRWPRFALRDPPRSKRCSCTSMPATAGLWRPAASTRSSSDASAARPARRSSSAAAATRPLNYTATGEGPPRQGSSGLWSPQDAGC